MDVQAVYILLRDGRCIYSRAYSENPADPQLLGGMLAAFNIASKQWLSDGIRKFEADGGLSFVVKDFESFIVTFQVSRNLTNEKEAFLDIIGYKFFAKYGNTLSPFEGNITIYKGFTPILDNILGVITSEEGRTKQNIKIRGIIDDDKVLDSLTIIELPRTLQKTALDLLTVKQATPEELASGSDCSVEEVEHNLENLLNQGYIMCKTIGSRKLYYIP
ncbi:MAG: hypothetical protein HeimC3_26670 [Candidatus Heimdallarchaeota archaeon LC_3]|nr:MAG: hypothetical protein HeimC3_26670 [Candidatus Heimdallarchaeota archaeon LC_3]